MLGHNFPPVLLLSSLPFFFFLFLFRFVVDSKPSAGDHKKKPERARELGTSAASFVISRCIEGDMRGGGNIWFSLSWNSPWHHATGEKKKETNNLQTGMALWMPWFSHTRAPNSLSYTDTYKGKWMWKNLYVLFVRSKVQRDEERKQNIFCGFFGFKLRERKRERKREREFEPHFLFRELFFVRFWFVRLWLTLGGCEASWFSLVCVR